MDRNHWHNLVGLLALLVARLGGLVVDVVRVRVGRRADVWTAGGISAEIRLYLWLSDAASGARRPLRLLMCLAAGVSGWRRVPLGLVVCAGALRPVSLGLSRCMLLCGSSGGD